MELDFSKIITLTSCLLWLPNKEGLIQGWQEWLKGGGIVNSAVSAPQAISSLTFMNTSACSKGKFCFLHAVKSQSPGEGPPFCEFFQWQLLWELVNGSMEIVASQQNWNQTYMNQSQQHKTEWKHVYRFFKFWNCENFSRHVISIIRKLLIFYDKINIHKFKGEIASRKKIFDSHRINDFLKKQWIISSNPRISAKSFCVSATRKK